MKIWLTLASIISVVSLPAQAYGGASSYPEVTCKLITPKWLGLGRLTKTLKEQQLVDFNLEQDKQYTRNKVRKMMRKAVIEDVGRRQEHTFTFHPHFSWGAYTYFSNPYSEINDNVTEGITFALITHFHDSIVPVLEDLHLAGKIRVDENILKPITDSTWANMNEVYRYMELYNAGSYGGMKDSITIVDDVNAIDQEIRYEGFDHESKRNILVGNCTAELPQY